MMLFEHWSYPDDDWVYWRDETGYHGRNPKTGETTTLRREYEATAQYLARQNRPSTAQEPRRAPEGRGNG